MSRKGDHQRKGGKPSARPRVSAGLLMYDAGDDGDGLRVFLAHPGGPFFAKKDEGSWTIPKGEPEPGEDLFACALREFEEEVGLAPPDPADVEYIPLGDITQKGGKTVHAWAFAGTWEEGRKPCSNTFTLQWPPFSKHYQEFPEADRAEMFPLARALKVVKNRQSPLIERLAEELNRRTSRR